MRMLAKIIATVSVACASTVGFAQGAGQEPAALLRCDSEIGTLIAELRKHPEAIKGFAAALKPVDVPIAYCNGMGDDGEWHSFTSKAKNAAAADWVMRIQVLEAYFKTRFTAKWIGTTRIDASEEPLLESRSTALHTGKGGCRSYYLWGTQGICFLPPYETQVALVKKVQVLVRMRAQR